MTKEQFDFYSGSLMNGDIVELSLLISNSYVPVRIIVQSIEEKDGEIYIVDADNQRHPISRINRIGR